MSLNSSQEARTMAEICNKVKECDQQFDENACDHSKPHEKCYRCGDSCEEHPDAECVPVEKGESES